MDEGPFRMPRPADRSATNRPEPSHRPSTAPPPEEPQPVVKEEPKPVHRPTASHRFAKDEEKSLKRFIVPVAIAVVAIILFVVGVLLWPKSQNTAIDAGKYQAVFFTNDNVYFGKLEDFNDKYYKMTKVYYPQAQQNATTTDADKQQTVSNQNNITLLKLSDAIHGPEDSMMIAKDQVLFYQNLKADSKVSKLIDNQK